MTNIPIFNLSGKFFLLPITFVTLSLLHGEETGLCELKPIYELIQGHQLQKAYQRAKKLYEQCQDKEHGRLYAKLAFWNKDLDTAFGLLNLFDPKEKLYRQIYAAKVIRDLKAGRYPKIPTFLEDDYDVLAARIEALIREHRFAKAYRLSRRLYDRYHSREALEMQANLLFWMKRYSESLRLFKRLGNRKKVKQISQAMLEEKMTKVDQKITLAWERSEKFLARTYFDKLSQKEQSFYRTHYRDNACRVEGIRMLGLGFDHTQYSDHRYRDHSNYLEFTLPIKRFTFYGKVEDTHRYGLHDSKFYAEIYPPGSKGYWGYLSLSGTPDADFYSRYSVGGYLYKDIGNEVLGIGYLYSHYVGADSHLANIEYRHYFNDYLSLKGVFYYEFHSHSYAAGLELNYETPCHLKIKTAYLYSSAQEVLSDERILSETGHKLEGELEYPLFRSSSVGIGLHWHRSSGGSHYISRGVSLYLRHYW